MHAASFVPAPISRSRPEVATAAHAEGFAAGWAAGARAAATAAAAQRAREGVDHERRETRRDEEVRSALAALNASAARWRELTVPVLVEAEQTLHRASLELAEAVIAREVRPGPDSAAALLARALVLPQGMPATVLRLSAADLPHVEGVLERGEAVLPEGVIVMSDPELGPGESITEHQAGMLDARIGQALERARAELEDER